MGRRRVLMFALVLATATAAVGVAPATASPRRVVAAKAPTRIVSISPTANEMLYAIGAGHQVVAVDSFSDYPSRAPSPPAWRCSTTRCSAGPYCSFLGTETARDVSLARDVLARLGVADLAGRLVETLSGGERQRVVLSRALLQAAPVLLLDEPTSALDIGHQQDVLELVETLRAERNLAVVSTMHDLTLAGFYADELVLLNGGRIVERGPADAVLTEQHLRAHFGRRGERARRQRRAGRRPAAPGAPRPRLRRGAASGAGAWRCARART